MPMQVIYPPQGSGLEGLLALAQIYDIYQRNQQREFDKLYQTARMTGTPAEMATLYDKQTNWIDWLFNTPMYQKKKYYEKRADEGAKMADIYDQQKSYLLKMYDIAQEVEKMKTQQPEPTQNIETKNAQQNNTKTKQEQQTPAQSAPEDFETVNKQFGDLRNKFINIIETDPTVILQMPEDLRNKLIDDYYKMSWAKSGSQIDAADKANALIKTVNQYLDKTLPYYEYLKQDTAKELGSGRVKEVKIYGFQDAKIYDREEAKKLTDTAANLGLVFEASDVGTGVNDKDAKKKKEGFLYDNDKKLREIVETKFGENLPSVFSRKTKDYVKLLNDMVLPEYNEMLARKGAKYRLQADMIVTPTTSKNILTIKTIPADQYKQITQQQQQNKNVKNIASYIQQASK